MASCPGIEPVAGDPPGIRTEPGATAERGGGWGWSLLLGVALFLVYTANRRAIGAGDVVPATFLPVALIRGDGPFLDRFDHALRTPEGRLPGYAAETRGHSVSRYPVGAALLAVPFVLPQVLALDWQCPGWERDGARARRECRRMGKNAAAAIVALAAVALYHLLRGLGLRRAALPAVLAAALGSDSWAVASQGLWQHGPAALCLTGAMLWLLPRAPACRRPGLAGLATALLVVCRPIDLVFAVVIALGVLRRCPRRERLRFFAPAALTAVALGAYNVWFFDTLAGGYAQIEAMHPWAHGVKGTWTGDLLGGAAGTLLSPSHGLFVFSPWVALALATLPATAGRLGRWPLVRGLLWGLVPYSLLLAKYSCWWGGHSFGPRFWIDATPLLAVVLGCGLEWARIHCRPLLGALAVAVALSVGIQVVGALCYPSSWHGTPKNADRHHERLWDWRDSELSRCVREGVRPRAW
jgi:hypothetical protein